MKSEWNFHNLSISCYFFILTISTHETCILTIKTPIAPAKANEKQQMLDTRKYTTRSKSKSDQNDFCYKASVVDLGITSLQLKSGCSWSKENSLMLDGVYCIGRGTRCLACSLQKERTRNLRVKSMLIHPSMAVILPLDTNTVYEETEKVEETAIEEQEEKAPSDSELKAIPDPSKCY